MWPFRKPKPKPQGAGRRGIYDAGRPSGRVLGPDGSAYAATLDSLPGWLATLEPPNASVRQAMLALRRASRVEHARGGHLRSAVLAFRREVVGSGLLLRSLHPEREVRRRLEAAWNRWAAQCDVGGRLTWRGLCHAAVSSVVVDGEAVVRTRRGAEWPDGLALELVDAVRLSVEVNSDPVRGASVLMGVEMDAYSRPVAYWITRRPGATLGYGAGRALGEPVAAEDVCHVFDAADLPGVVRGIPWAFASLRRFADIREYDDAERAAAKKGASIYAVYKPPEGVGLGDGEDEEDEEGNAKPPPIEVAPNNVAELEPGGDLDFHTPTHPNDRYDGFVSAQLRAAAASLGMSYATLTADLSRANFVSSRLGRLAERGTVLLMRELLVERLAMPVFRAWLETAYLRGELPMRPLADLEAVRWDGPAMEHVQPREAAAADHQRLADGLVSKAELIRATGRDPEEVFDEIRREQQAAAAGAGTEADVSEPEGKAAPPQPAPLHEVARAV